MQDAILWHISKLLLDLPSLFLCNTLSLPLKTPVVSNSERYVIVVDENFRYNSYMESSIENDHVQRKKFLLGMRNAAFNLRLDSK